MGFSNTFDD
jgi:dual specificity tyrosine-phosphorylation-regulated kinase 2/3/4